MPNHLGNEGLVEIGTNQVAEVKTWSISEEAAIVEDIALGDAAAGAKSGTTRWSGSVVCHWDETDTTGQGALTVGAEVTINFKAEGDTIGDTYFTGSALVSRINRQGAQDEIVEAAFDFVGNGALTETTV